MCRICGNFAAYIILSLLHPGQPREPLALVTLSCNMERTRNFRSAKAPNLSRWRTGRRDMITRACHIGKWSVGGFDDTFSRKGITSRRGAAMKTPQRKVPYPSALSRMDSSLTASDSSVNQSSRGQVGVRGEEEGKPAPPPTEVHVEGAKINGSHHQVHEGDEDDRWEPTDVEADLRQLRAAVAKARADDDLASIERRALLDAFARGRRPILPDVVRYVAAPVLIATLLARSASRAMSATASSGSWSLSVIRALDVHYWCIVVVAPITLLLDLYYEQFSKRQRQRQERKGVVSASSSFSLKEDSDLSKMFPWKMPGTPAGNRIDGHLCLLEMISSSVFGHAVVLGAFAACLRRPNLRRALGGTLSTGNACGDLRISFAFAAARLVNRLGAAAAAYQYPKLAYELRRSDQQRPLTKRTALLQQVVGAMLLGLPLGLACDMAKVVAIGHSIKNQSTLSLGIPAAKISRWLCVGLVASVLGPILQLLAFRRILNIELSTDVSLAQDYRTVKSLLTDAERMRQKRRWRWRLLWRKPQRLSRSLRNLAYLFFAEYEAHSDRRQRMSKVRQTPTFDLQDVDSSRPDNVLRLMAKYMEENPNMPPLDRSSWAPKATAHVASKLQRQYENKSFEDPLGVAVQQTLGIGLSFDYDHDTRLRKGETPSIHRLRARAAKSAVRRVQQLYDPKMARQRLDLIPDPQREREGAKMQRDAQREVEYLANSLLSLIPTNVNPPEGVDLDILPESTAADLHVDLPRPSDPRSWVASHEEPPTDVYERFVRQKYGDGTVHNPGLKRIDSALDEVAYGGQVIDQAPTNTQPKSDDDKSRFDGVERGDSTITNDMDGSAESYFV